MSDDRSRIDELERSMEATRGRMAATVAELDEVVSARVAAAKESVDLRRLVVDHPWPSLFLALGAGILLARSGADERAAYAADESSVEEVAAVDAGLEDSSDESTRPQGIAMRVSKALHGDELLDDMRGEADRIGGMPPGRPDANWHQI